MESRYLLSIDTSCDDSCAAIWDLKENRLLSDVVDSHIQAMERFGGIVPEVASRKHLVSVPDVVDRALKKAGITLSDLDRISVTHQPGLIGSLLVGVTYAKSLAYALGIPFSVVNHVEAHLYSPFLAESEGVEVPKFPWVALVVSGGHTDLYHVKGVLDHGWLGGTLDDAAGEAFDKIGKLVGISYPAGPTIDRWVRESATESDRQKYAFPRARLELGQFSFSGLKTAVANQIKKLGPQIETEKLALLASAQEAIIDMIVFQIEKAKNVLGVSQVVVTGGVACNSRLRSRLPEAYFPQPRHCSDNAAMVAGFTALECREKKLSPASFSVSAST